MKQTTKPIESRRFPKSQFGLLVSFLDITEDVFLPGFEEEWLFMSHIKFSADQYGRATWHVNDKLHSLRDKPAIEYVNGDKSWWCNDKLHRENDNPAVVTKERLEWWYHGMRHRENDKPAIIGPHRLEWWYKGRLVQVKNIEHCLSVEQFV